MSCILATSHLAKLVSFAWWGTLYLCSAYSFTGKSPEWHSRIISLLHGTVGAVVGLSQCNILSVSLLRLTSECTVGQYALMLWSWGYFAIDLLWCLYYWTETALMLGHHASAVISISIYMQKQNTGCTFACCLAVMEITNPFLQVRWFSGECTVGHYALMLWSWGYFAIDLLWCLYYWTETALMLGHHASAVISISIYMQKQNTGCTFACCLAVMEITNPFLQVRWFLKTEGYDETRFYRIIEISYIFLFVTVRGVFGTYVLCKVLPCSDFHMEEKLILVIFYLVSIGFICDVFGFVTYKYRGFVGKCQQVLDRYGIILNE